MKGLTLEKWPKQLSMAASESGSLIFKVVLRGKARYQPGHSAQYSGFKLAGSTFASSILELEMSVLFFLTMMLKHFKLK